MFSQFRYVALFFKRRYFLFSKMLIHINPRLIHAPGFLLLLSFWWQTGSEIELKRVCVSHTFPNNRQTHDHRLPGSYLCTFVTQAIVHRRRTNPFHRKHFLLSYHKSSSVSSLVSSPDLYAHDGTLLVNLAERTGGRDMPLCSFSVFS